MLTMVIIAAAFVGVATLVGGVFLLFKGGRDSVLDERLKRLAGVAEQVSKKTEPSLLASPLGESSHPLKGRLLRISQLSNLCEQADLPLSQTAFLFISIASGTGPAVLCLLCGMPWWSAPLLGMPCSFLPWCWLLMRRRRRLQAFTRQLPDALELIGRALRAGHSLAAGCNFVATEMSDPIRKEFNRCYEEQNLGIPLETALQEMANRVPNLDLRFFSTAVILQRSTGGDLAEMLDKIGNLIRERFKIWGQIQALTGEGRLSGVVLLALPPVLMIVMFYMNPRYLMPLFGDSLGHKMLIGGIVMQLLGAFVIKKIIDIKV